MEVGGENISTLNIKEGALKAVNLKAGGVGASLSWQKATVDLTGDALIGTQLPAQFQKPANLTLRDGTFKIGWMPIGKYAVMLERTGQSAVKKGPQKTMYNVPDGLTIEEGKKEYVIELGKDFKP